MNADINDEDIRLLFMEGDPKIHQRALMDLYDRTAPAIIGYLRKNFFSFDDHQLEQVVGEAFIQLSGQIEEGAVDLEQPLKNFLLKIVFRRATDLRRRLTRKRQPGIDFMDDVSNALLKSGASLDWKRRVRSREAVEIVEQFEALIPTLPRVQRVVAEAIANAFPINLSLEELCDEVESLTGTRPTVPSVKDARKQVRTKFQELL